MKLAFSAVLALLVLCCSGIAQADPAMPTLPLRYRAVVETSTRHLNMTITYREQYDHVAQLARIDSYNGDRFPMATVFIYGNNEASTLIAGSTCLKNTISGNASPAGNPFGFTYFSSNNTVVLPLLSTMLRFGPQYNTTYTGQSWVRNIPADQWTTWHSTNLTSVVYNVFFTTDTWAYASQANPVLIRFQKDGWEVVNGVNSSFSFEQDFIQFSSYAQDLDFVLEGCSSNYRTSHPEWAGVIVGIAFGCLLGLMLARWSLHFTLLDKKPAAKPAKV
ncbi:hypothetical protein CAOG_03148 [Capsaspora owczarzaki ATCC 30864]|uniref:LolA-like domain-containing protein n=1 Tax=Capsaspora owczarzaki (strain ATCC 30864) TaxID=595528 RepID=A0A0D2WMN5_CAPO3|nr:hypothetical protein CAOG_03148 [Capsaspora owczarzaki ATCC 30864]KJE92130.1 hypothetical protein CAOG_003148 [Capsaspora owczarzaki ATCC 30864]|eukprot:XP_004363987.1 hypothetical protein CAOG_03148 [Capsaspora owczarzaki ATCC 30864]